MDFIERLTARINEISDLPIKCKMGYLGTGESLVVYPLPGSKIIKEYMDGVTEQTLNYEIAMKSKSQSSVNNTLWLIQNELEDLKELTSKNGSFEFDNLTITNKPYINALDKQGWFVFLLDIQASIIIFKGE